MRNRKGSTLVITVIVFAILTIFATFIMNFMVSENKQAIHHQNKTEAYYVARGGAVAVETAIVQMSESRLLELIGLLNDGAVTVGEIDLDGNKANVTLTKEEDKLLIESVGQVGDVSQIVTKVMFQGSITTTVEIETAVFSLDDMTVENGTIHGDVGTNNNINITGWPTINGNAWIMDEENITSTNQQWPISKWSSERNKILPSEILYPLPVFPNYFVENGPSKIPEFLVFSPGVSKETNLDFSSVNKITISSSKYYSGISIPNNKTLEIDARASNIIVWVESLHLSGGDISILGNKKVEIHIKNSLDFNSSKPFSTTSNPSKVNVYYSGSSLRTNSADGIYANLYLNPSSTNVNIENSKIYGNIYIYKGNFSTSGGSPNIIGNIYSKSGNVTTSGGEITGDIYVYNGNFVRSDYGNIIGNLYVKAGDVKLGGSGKLTGSVITSGNKVVLDGSGKIAEGLLYAPNADVRFEGSGSLDGAIISKTFHLEGGGSVQFMPEYIDTSLIDTKSSSSISYRPGYFK